MMENKEWVWLTVQGVSKKDILEGLGFEVNKNGLLILNGEKVKAIDDPELDVKANDVRAILPGSLKVVTDISEIEILFPPE
jgi:hypothetical protein